MSDDIDEMIISANFCNTSTLLL